PAGEIYCGPLSPAGGGGAERRGWTRQRANGKRHMCPPLAGVARSAGGGPDKGQRANGKCIPRWRGWRGAPGVDPTKGKRQTANVSPAGGGGAERRGWTRQRAKSKRQ